MKCYHPVKAWRTPHGVVFDELRRHDILGTVEIRCGQCVGCRERRAADWATRVMHEASMWASNCFVTLTYSPGNLPPNASLEHRDYQLFMKRLRFKYSDRTIRYFMCGEYGPLNQRPHYHACLFNVDFRSDRVPQGRSGSGFLFYSSAELADVWSLGNVSVQDLTRETAAYCARYIMKKALGETAKTAYQSVDDDGVITQRVPEYAAMSKRPYGIGATWFELFGRDVYRGDFVVAQRPGASAAKLPAPKYYDKLLKRKDEEKFDEVAFKREDRARQRFAQYGAPRLGDEETVHLARIKSLTRGDL